MPMHVAVAVSGRGSNLEALLRALGPEGPARVVLVLSDRPDAPALERAAEHGLAGVALRNPSDAQEWLAALQQRAVDQSRQSADFERTRLMLAARDTKVLEKLAATYRSAERHVELRVEQHAMDEHAARGHRRSGDGEPT